MPDTQRPPPDSSDDEGSTLIRALIEAGRAYKPSPAYCARMRLDFIRRVGFAAWVQPLYRRPKNVVLH
jgi:hypothetical protein